VLECRLDQPDAYIDAVCSYAGFRHRRRLWFRPGVLVCVLDEVEGSGGVHEIEQFWHSGAPCTRLGLRRFRLGAGAVLATEVEAALESGGEHGWRSRVLGSKEPAAVVSWGVTSELPFLAATAVFLDARDGSVHSEQQGDGGARVVCDSGGNRIVVAFSTADGVSVSQ
jgi:hypothetical protein